MGKRNLLKALKKIRLAVFDFDGVFTDNRVLVMQDGREGVFCNRSDGLGISLLRQAGISVQVISAEENPVVRVRCRKLKIPCIFGSSDKLSAMKRLLIKRRIEPTQVLYMGNDSNDLDCLKAVGVPICVADSHPSIFPYAVYVTRQKGGQGAVREICDLLLEAERAKLS
jgi:YrbI family 3-deoxy-D-manno-octulosonate 8-phosphate phosphatase